jgi:hypothetical protein
VRSENNSEWLKGGRRGRLFFWGRQKREWDAEEAETTDTGGWSCVTLDTSAAGLIGRGLNGLTRIGLKP